MPKGPGTYGNKRGRPPMKMKTGGSVSKKTMGGSMDKRPMPYKAGGRIPKKMSKGGTLIRGTRAQRSGRMARGPMG
mgnify:CR=1|jgi:hypothetical protein